MPLDPPWWPEINKARIVQNMAGEIFVHACHILKRAETCLVASQNIYY